MASAKSNPSNPRDDSSFRRFAMLLRPYTWALAMTLVLQVLLAGVNMIMPLFMKLLLDRVFPPENEHRLSLLFLILFGIIIVYFARNLLYYRTKTTAVKVGENVCFNLRNRLFEHLQRLSLLFYKQNRPGTVSSRVMDDSFVVQSFISDELPKLLQAFFMFQGLVIVIYVINPLLALASTIVLPLHLLTFHYFKRPIKESSKVAQQQLGVVHGNLIEKFLGVEVVKGFTAEDRENEAFNEAISISRNSQVQSKTYLVKQKVAADMLVGLGTISLLGFGAWQVMYKGMQPGTFVAFFTYVLMLYPTVLALMSGFAKLTKATASVDRIFEMIETGQREAEVGGSTHKPIRGHLRFESVNFSYGDGSAVLKDVSFDVPQGEVCAVVGPSGAGKTTLVSLVPRFLDPDLGKVTVDGTDLQDIDPRHLRQHVGIAFQECFLFNASILENLRYARPDAPMERIIEIAQRTGAHEFIDKLPEKYDTVVGESGVSLSRGEKQRITLTRAMLKDPRILILDEATASIDTASERQIIPAILEMMEGKTTLMITHRPELLRHADKVVRVVDGRIEYDGPPEELMDEQDSTRPFGSVQES